MQGFVGSLRWSPDGTQIAFDINVLGLQQIYVMSADGLVVTRLRVEADAHNRGPKWSPDGSKIVFLSQSSQGAGLFDIFMMNADGGGRTGLGIGFGLGFRWSPDGSKIVFRGNPEGLYVMNADGSGLTQLTSAPEGFRDGEARWSPDGTRIAFERVQFDGPEQYFVSMIFTINPDGSGLKRLSPLDADVWESQPRWRPSS